MFLSPFLSTLSHSSIKWQRFDGKLFIINARYHFLNLTQNKMELKPRAISLSLAAEGDRNGRWKLMKQLVMFIQLWAMHFTDVVGIIIIFIIIMVLLVPGNIFFNVEWGEKKNFLSCLPARRSREALIGSTTEQSSV